MVVWRSIRALSSLLRGAAVLCGLLAWFFFIAPFGSFELHFNSALALGFYIFIVSVDIALIHWMQVANRDLDAERRRTIALKDNTEVLFRDRRLRIELEKLSVKTLQQRALDRGVAAGLVSNAAIAVCRPAPFIDTKGPSVTEFMTELLNTGDRKTEEKTEDSNKK